MVKQGFDHNILDPDHLVEQIGVDAAVLPMIAAALNSNGFDYLQPAKLRRPVSSCPLLSPPAMAEQVAMAAIPVKLGRRGSHRS